MLKAKGDPLAHADAGAARPRSGGHFCLFEDELHEGVPRMTQRLLQDTMRVLGVGIYLFVNETDKYPFAYMYMSVYTVYI